MPGGHEVGRWSTAYARCSPPRCAACRPGPTWSRPLPMARSAGRRCAASSRTGGWRSTATSPNARYAVLRWLPQLAVRRLQRRWRAYRRDLHRHPDLPKAYRVEPEATSPSSLPKSPTAGLPAVETNSCRELVRRSRSADRASRLTRGSTTRLHFGGDRARPSAGHVGRAAHADRCRAAPSNEWRYALAFLCIGVRQDTGLIFERI